MAELETPTLPIEQSLDHILPELRPLARAMADLIPDPENARKHDAANLKMIAESLAAYGQRTPLVVNRLTGYISKGNGTYMAARMLGWTLIAWVYTDDARLDSLAYGLADNKTSDSSTFDYSQAGKHLRELKEGDYPMLQFFSEEESIPLLREEFQRPEISNEVFDPGLKKGRAISKVSSQERAVIDRAVAFIRSKSKKSVTEGAALEMICGEFLSQHANEIDNETTIDIQVEERKIAALLLD